MVNSVQAIIKMFEIIFSFLFSFFYCILLGVFTVLIYMVNLYTENSQISLSSEASYFVFKDPILWYSSCTKSTFKNAVLRFPGWRDSKEVYGIRCYHTNTENNGFTKIPLNWIIPLIPFTKVKFIWNNLTWRQEKGDAAQERRGKWEEAVTREASLLLVTERIEEHVDQRDRER